jgi:NTE family protein
VRTWRTALLLTGGGARAAYQVGVLKAVSELLGRPVENPFPILCGTSAGAINVGALACHAEHFAASVDHLVDVWRNFHAARVYRCDVPAIMYSGARWLGAMMLLYRRNPISLLDNSPLATLLAQRLEFERIAENIESRALYAVAVTASGYASGQSVTFYQGAGRLRDWKRPQRVGLATKLRLEHLLASSALPFIFPAVKLGREYFGDGSMRQVAPVSPALHLGADRVLVIGTGRQTVPVERARSSFYPSMAQIAGHALNSIFLDSLAQDVEWLERINRMIETMPSDTRGHTGQHFRHVDVLVISPSQPLERFASNHIRELPSSIKFLFRPLGVMRRAGSNLGSYLLFEPGFCEALIDLGFQDTLARGPELQRFLGEPAG